MMYSAYKLNKQDNNIQPWCTPFLIWNQSIVPCLVLTVASWPAYRFLGRQIRHSGIPTYWRIFQFFEIHMVKGFSIVSEAEVDVFLNSFAFSIIQQMLAIWFLLPLPLLNPTWTSGCSRYTYCWSLAWRILSITLLACGMIAIVQKSEHPFVLPFFDIGMKIYFSSPVATAEFPKFSGILNAAL